MKSTGKCEICREGEAKYKCPVCRTPYCSVVCCKTHKNSPDCKQPTPNSDNKTSNGAPSLKRASIDSVQFPTEDTVPPEKLALLGKSAELKAVLGNPHLQAMLRTVDTAPDARGVMEAAMQEPIFTEFVDLCMKLIDPQENESSAID